MGWSWRMRRRCISIRIRLCGFALLLLFDVFVVLRLYICPSSSFGSILSLESQKRWSEFEV